MCLEGREQSLLEWPGEVKEGSPRISAFAEMHSMRQWEQHLQWLCGWKEFGALRRTQRGLVYLELSAGRGR